MLEADNAFVKSISAFAHANDFIVSLYEGAHFVGEDIADKIADERNLRDVKGDERHWIEEEISGAVAFSWHLLPALLAAQLSLLEECLLDVCQCAAFDKKVPFQPPQTSPFTAEGAASFFRDELGVPLPSPWPVLEKIMEYQSLRDRWTGNRNAITDFDDRYLVDGSRAMQQFFIELRDHFKTSL